MLILAMDTATEVCTVALARDGQLLAEYSVHNGHTHSEGLLPQIEQLLVRSGVAKSEINLVAVSLGPGSFTGLRIGLATAEALAYSWHCPLQGVSTLEALAYNIPYDGCLLSPVLDAQKGNYYQALYTWRDGSLAEIAPAAVVTAAEALERVAATGTPGLLLGECQKLVESGLPEWLKPAPAALQLPRAYSVALVAAHDYNPKASQSCLALAPVYLRRSEAEVLWDERHGVKSK